jgi:asparagine synthase (glutamine-hydrolysing)
MCGLAAIFAYHVQAPAVDAGELTLISASMARRGPDGEGSWIGPAGRVGLAHRRLAIIDLDASANQPMAFTPPGATDTLRITYNGEIYNYRALRDELEAEGHVFRTQSDTEVLLHLYHEHGADMVRRLRGMYALAIWDGARRGMLLARDPFGIKPLYVADDGRTLRAASQVKALLAGGAVGGGPDPAGHAGFFLFGYVPEPHTLHASIRALPAGSTLWLDEGGGRREQSFFDVTETLAEEGAGEDDELGALLADSVAHHLVSDVPVGIFLSAGLDSATITGLASEAHGAGLETMTLSFRQFQGTDRDEAPLAERVAELYGTRHRTVEVEGGAFADELDGLFAAMDQPTIDGVNTYFVAKAAAGLGLKVALSGLGGDELFGGYDTFRQVPALVSGLGRIPGMRSLGRALRPLAAPVARALTSPKAAGMMEYGTRIGDAYLLRRALFMPWELPAILGGDLAEEGLRSLRPLHRLDQTQAPVAGGRRKVAALEMSWYMKNQLLRDADWAGMAHSLEIRVPLVDWTLFRALAGRLGRPGGPSKQDMAAAPATPLPDAILTRPKTGFTVPVGDWAGGTERGLRGWARRVYGEFTG